MIYSGKRNGLSVRAIQWTGTNLKEIWDFLEEYREKFGLVGLNFSFVKDLPTNLDLYQNCPIRLTNRETHVIETIVVGSWIMRPLDTSKDIYLFLDNETFQDQFQEVTLQIGEIQSAHQLHRDPTVLSASPSVNPPDALPVGYLDTAIRTGYPASAFEQTMADFSTSMPQFHESVKTVQEIPATDVKHLVGKIQDRMQILTDAGFSIAPEKTDEEAIRLAAGVQLLSRGYDIQSMPGTVADLQEWFLQLLDADCIAEFSAIPVATKKFIELTDLPAPMLQFIIRFPVTDWGTRPSDMATARFNALRSMGKMLYTRRGKPNTGAATLMSYSKTTRLKIMQHLISAYDRLQKSRHKIK